MDCKINTLGECNSRSRLQQLCFFALLIQFRIDNGTSSERRFENCSLANFQQLILASEFVAKDVSC